MSENLSSSAENIDNNGVERSAIIDLETRPSTSSSIVENNDNLDHSNKRSKIDKGMY